MLDGLYIASSAGVKQQRKLEVISNNLANLNTPGFKKDELVFKEMEPPFKATAVFEDTRSRPGLSSLSNTHGSSYVGVDNETINFKQGSLQKTGNPSDLALEGEGFFVVETPDGPRYTRQGSFRLNEQGQLVNGDGFVFQAIGETNILIPPDNPVISVDSQGVVSIGLDQETQNVGQLKLVRFENPRALKKEGEGLYSISDPDRQAIPLEDAKVLQGFVENSNVNAVEEMTRMIQTVRTFEAYQKIIQSIDEADQQSVTSIARLA